MDSPPYCSLCSKYFATPSSKRRHDQSQHGSKKIREEVDDQSTESTPSPTPTPSSPANSNNATDIDADSESSETGDSSNTEAEQPDGILRAMVAAFVSCKMRPKTTRGLMKILQNPNQLRMLRRALKEEIYGSLQYAKELQNTPEWMKIKATEQKLSDQVHIRYCC